MQPSFPSNQFLIISKDSGALLNVNNSEFNGLYTNDLSDESTAIVVKGDKGVALIHESGLLTENSIKSIFRELGDIQFWTLGYYSFPCSENKSEETFNAHYEKIKRVMETFLGAEAQKKYRHPTDNQPYFTATNQALFVDREGNINNAPPNSYQMVEVPSSNLRRCINAVNRQYLIKKQMDCDLQYDGNKFTAIPSLVFTEAQIKNLGDTDAEFKRLFKRYLNLKES